ncbi:MAG: PorT family protein [Gemmatimonadota bacterium]|nr:MAG: PorT family protein [Gemmatimonadota bacterium]
MMPKRLVWVFALLLGLTVPTAGLQAQGIRLGLKAGAANSDIAQVDNTEKRWGFVGGAYVGLGLGSIIVQPELLYVQRKARVLDGDANLVDLNQDYVDVPLLVGFTFGIIVKPMLYLGPVASFETSCGISFETLSSECTDFDTKSAVLSGAIGAALDVGLFNIDVRYNVGLSDLQDGADGKWNTLMITAGVGLSLGL